MRFINRWLLIINKRSLLCNRRTELPAPRGGTTTLRWHNKSCLTGRRKKHEDQHGDKAPEIRQHVFHQPLQRRSSAVSGLLGGRRASTAGGQERRQVSAPVDPRHGHHPVTLQHLQNRPRVQSNGGSHILVSVSLPFEAQKLN